MQTPMTHNIVILSGTIKDEPKFYANQDAALWRAVLVNTHPETGEPQNLPIVAKGPLAERVMRKIARQGSRLSIEAYVQVRKWVNKTTNRAEFVTEFIITRPINLDYTTPAPPSEETAALGTEEMLASL
jgi:single-stranded DNA-binding protein